MAEWGSDERELIRRCREGSEAAFAALVRLHRPRLYTLAYRLTGDRATAEDVVQETFLAAFKGLDKFEPKPSLAPWLNTIAIRTAGRHAADRRRGWASLDARVSSARRDGSGSNGNGGADAELALGAGLVDVDPAGDPEQAYESAELRAAVSSAIAMLPFAQRAAVTLRYVLGLDYAEAAAAMDVPLNTFKSHLLRGTRELRERLAAVLEPPTAAPANDGEGAAVIRIRTSERPALR